MKRRALILGTLACISWSTVFVLGRLTISRHATDPVVLGLYRFAITGIVLAAIVVSLGRGRELMAFAREPLPFLFLGLTGGFAMGFFVFLALQHTHSIVVQIIMNSNPVLIVPLSLLVGERVGVGKVCGVVLGVAGCVLVLSGVSPDRPPEGASVLQPHAVSRWLGDEPCGTAALGCVCDPAAPTPAQPGAAVPHSLRRPRHLLGGALAALSGLAWAAYTVFGRRVVQRHGGLVTTTISMLIGGVAFLVACLVMGKALVLPWQGALSGVYLALIPTAFGFTAWYVALKDLPANVLGPLQFVVPIGGVALAIALLGERLTPLMLLGGALALAGVYLSTRQR